MKKKLSTDDCTKRGHCWCRSKVVTLDAHALRKTRVQYCCWCGKDKKERAS